MSARVRRTLLALACAGIGGVLAWSARIQPMPRTAAPVVAPPETRAATPSGLALWILPDSVKVRPGADLGAPSAPDVPVRLRAARGEVVAFQVALASLEGSARVTVDVSDLRSGARRIERGRLGVFLETVLYCPEVEAKFVGLPAGEYPDPLVPLWENGPGTRPVASPFALPARRNQMLWVDVPVAHDVPAGLYLGRLTIEAAGVPARGVPLELTVDAIELPARPSLAAWVPLYETRLWQREGLGELAEPERRARLFAYWRMAHEHRFATQVMEQEPELRWDEATGALLGEDWSGFDADYGPMLDGSLFPDATPPRLFKVGGFIAWGAEPGKRPHFGGDQRRDTTPTAAHRRAVTEYAAAAARHFDAKGWTAPERFMYMLDEPPLAERPGLAGLVRGYGEAIHAAGAGVRHLVTMGPHESAGARGFVDIWAAWGAGYRPAEMRARQALGERAWFYQQHEPFVGGHSLNDEGLALRTWGWIARRYGVDAVFLWVGNFWNEDPYRVARNWSDGQLGNGALFYPGAMLPSLGFPALAGPVSSFRMKALRRGLLDYEYMALLDRLGGDSGPVVRSLVRSALNEAGYDPYWNHPLWTKPGDWSHDPAAWEAARARLADAILERLREPAR